MLHIHSRQCRQHPAIQIAGAVNEERYRVRGSKEHLCRSLDCVIGGMA
jgi:hypothetical protein